MFRHQGFIYLMAQFWRRVLFNIHRDATQTSHKFKPHTSNVSIPVGEMREILQHKSVIPLAKCEHVPDETGKKKKSNSFLITLCVACQSRPSKIPFEINPKKKMYLDVLEQKDLEGRIYQLS